MKRDLRRGHDAHLVLVDVEAAELLVLPSPGDGDGARGQLPERSSNHGCGDVGGRFWLLRSGNPTSVEEESIPFRGLIIFLFTLFSPSFSFLRRGAVRPPGQ
jgi:hypothetical protein